MSMLEYWLTPEGLILLQAKSRDSLTKTELASKLGVSPSTLAKWDKNNMEIATAVRQGREITDATVENAILKKALGFSVNEVKKVIKADGAEEITTVSKCIPPDISAASVWLKNRCPDKWSDKPGQQDGELLKVDEILRGIDAQIDG